jgi:hypothetical protein
MQLVGEAVSGPQQCQELRGKRGHTLSVPRLSLCDSTKTQKEADHLNTAMEWVVALLGHVQAYRAYSSDEAAALQLRQLLLCIV